jgi:hypothetical protein
MNLCCYNVSVILEFNSSMEQRKHPRVQLPLLVELQHPSLNRGRALNRGRSVSRIGPSSSAQGESAEGSQRYIARDISEGGVFVHLDVPPTITPGAKLRLTLLNPSNVDNLPTPTVDMVVKRVEDNGLGLAFVNETSRHLWQSVERLRDELAVGRDYFQVYQSAVVVNDKGQLLLVQNRGKWGYPGEYLIVGENWQAAIMGYLAGNFGLTDLCVVRVLGADSGSSFDLPEAAVFKTYVLVTVNASQFAMPENSQAGRFRDFRWVERKRDVEALTFVDDEMRKFAHQALEWTTREQQQP